MELTKLMHRPGAELNVAYVACLFASALRDTENVRMCRLSGRFPWPSVSWSRIGREAFGDALTYKRGRGLFARLIVILAN
jgi:hypothetical protein